MLTETSGCHARSLGNRHNLNGATDVRHETLTGTPPTDVPLLPSKRRTDALQRLTSGSKMAAEPVMYSGRWPTFNITIARSGVSSNDPTIPHPAKDHLLNVYMRGDGRVALRFLDGFVGEMDLADLGLDTSRLRIGTVRASSWGGAVEVEDQDFHTVHIDASVLRAHLDPQYAAILKEAIAELQQP